MSKTTGFTLIELLLVMAIVSIIFVATSPFVSSTLQRYQTISTEDRLLSALRQAQSFATHNRLNQTWGVCITSGILRLYASSCSSPVRNTDWTLPPTINISGFTDLSFSSYRGEPSSTPTIIISTGVKTSTITINQKGGVNVN